MKKNISTIFIILIFGIGVSLLLYPTVSNFWNERHQSKVIANYVKAVEKLDSKNYEEILQEAKTFNQSLEETGLHFPLTEEEDIAYQKALNPTQDGIMGYIEIPKIHVKLAIYHGTSDAILQIAAGHLEGSSLPIGGESTHAVLLGHRGLPSAKLFTSLDKLVLGDLFYLSYLNQKIAYEVDEIKVVEPEELNQLQIEEGKDLVTLVTCTPYGINSHRLLVRGHQVPISQEMQEELEQSTKKKSIWILFLVLFLFLLLLGLFLYWRKKKGRKKHEKK